jgi:ubiquinone/menaquinone biosynthesis C-methylase UbiE
MFHDRMHAGSSPDLWEENWEVSGFEDSVRFMPIDPLRPLFEKHLRSDSTMLEGGCGIGSYVAYYAARGHDVIGLDFAQKTLKILHTRQPSLKLIGGDVANMPFPDKTFDLYYSGGVVEHFEGGAEKALREARRVLKDDGVLMISVPYLSPLRRLLLPLKGAEWRRVTKAAAETEGAIDGKKFFQYAYTTAEFKKMLADAGLKTIKTKGYAILWGLKELPGFRGSECEHAGVAKPGIANTNGSAPIDVSPLIKDQPGGLLKRLVVSEDESVPILGLGVHFMGWAAANMMMYVCVKDSK